ncbi:MAG: phytoene desaturase family protein [Bacteroidota bacterium]|nr:phytoene desaturase family protein [Bacteroidota bacterium]
MGKVSVIGSGFSGLSTAAFLAKDGHQVSIFEKNSTIGGRARQFSADGFVFDMGPSWYWMADVFEKFFHQFGKKPSDYFELIQLNPGFQIIFNQDTTMEISSDWDAVCELFEHFEKGSSSKLNAFMKEAEYKYDIGINQLVYEPGLSLIEVCKSEIFLNVFKLQVFTSYRKHVAKYFKNPYLRSLLEFPVLFLGTAPNQTPALYSLMTYSGIKKGTFYPMGGFGKVIEGFKQICLDQGVSIHTDEEVQSVTIKDRKIQSIQTKKGEYDTDVLIGSADYSHVDGKILPKEYSNYSSSYWKNRTFSPSSLLFYLGVNKKIDKLIHHNLFFDEDIEQHTDEIYKDPQWPKQPLFYVCCPSKTDPEVAPAGMENLFFLMPIAPGLMDTNDIREKYFNIMIKRLEKYTNQSIEDAIVYKRSYCVNDFVDDYNAYKGNAYGLANTLMQTANLKPKIINKKLSNLFYTGQLTVPGPGVPPSIISGQVVAKHIVDSNLLSL